jgi:hypothetical protein
MGFEGRYIGFTDQVIEVHDDPGLRHVGAHQGSAMHETDTVEVDDIRLERADRVEQFAALLRVRKIAAQQRARYRSSKR